MATLTYLANVVVIAVLAVLVRVLTFLGLASRGSARRSFRRAGGLTMIVGALALVVASSHLVSGGAAAAGTWGTLLASAVLIVLGLVVMRRYRGDRSG